MDELAQILARRSEPVRLTVGNLKGGTGKSTSAVLLALALARASSERVLLVDADTVNATTFEWSEFAGDSWPESVTVNYWPSVTLAKRVRDVEHTGHVVIDTGPSDASILRQALMVTDHLVIPIAATPAEATRMMPTLKAAAEVGATRNDLGVSALFTRTRQGTVSLRETKEAVAELGIPVLDTEVPFILQYSQAFGSVPDDLGVYPQVLVEILTNEESA